MQDLHTAGPVAPDGTMAGLVQTFLASHLHARSLCQASLLIQTRAKDLRLQYLSYAEVVQALYADSRRLGELPEGASSASG